MSRRLAHLHCTEPTLATCPANCAGCRQCRRGAVQVWCALLALAFVMGLMTWLAPTAYGEHARKPSTIRSVSPIGTDFGDCSGPPCKHIQYAITQSSYGDRINVASGIYTEHITMTSGVSVYGTGWDATQTVINGNFSGSQPTVYFPSSIDATTVLSGVQVTHGGTGDPVTSPDGGGINIYLASPQIINTWVVSNTGLYGGGVYVSGGSPTFVNVPAWLNVAALSGGGFYFADAIVTMTDPYQVLTSGTIWLNKATNGGGLYSSGVTLTLSGLRINGNQALTGDGGGIHAGGPYPIVIRQNDISLNTGANNGGGITTYSADNLQISSNTILSNTGAAGGGLYLYDSSGFARSNLIIGNQTGVYGGGAFIAGTSTGFLMEGNWFEKNGAGSSGGGLSVISMDKTFINANVFFTNTANDAGGISAAYVPTSAVTITNNIVAHNTITSSNVAGISVYGTAARVANNTVANNGGDGILFSSANGIQLLNNIVFSNTYGIVRSDGSTYTADYNDVYSNTFNYSSVLTGTHDLSVNPLFLGTGNLFTYYHLQPTSPVSKTGSLAYAPPFDIDGERRAACTSMGADQICSKSLFLPLVLK